MKRRPAMPGTLKFMAIAILFMLLIDHFYYGGTRPYIEEARREQSQALVPSQPEPAVKADEEAQDVLPEQESAQQAAEPPAWQKYAVPVSVPEGMPMITVIIDDLGEYAANTKEAIHLPGPVTLAFLPYPKNAAKLAGEGRAAGHEILLHMPMEAEEADLDRGTYVLRASMIPGTFEEVLEKNLSAFDGYVGVNNHMGSRLTQDAEAMRIVMAHLYRRGLLFVDSRTIGGTVAEKTAADYGIPHAGRDVFLDNEPDEKSVLKNLESLEKVARHKGRAIGICHPKGGTIKALKEWLPTLEKKGFALVPVSMQVRGGDGMTEPESASAVKAPELMDRAESLAPDIGHIGEDAVHAPAE